MDKKLLESLGNLSLALEQIAEALKSKSGAQSSTAQALQNGDFLKEIKDINKGVIQLQKDTKQILANQQTLMKMGKSKKEDTAAERLGGDKKAQNDFVQGIKVILLIAVAVLALGVAFKLIGGVNFLSVIALSFSLVILTQAFVKMIKGLKEVNFDAKKDGINFVLSVTAISLGITISSFILSMVVPLTFSKLFTIVFLGAGFALLTPSIVKILRAFKGMSMFQIVKSVIFLPLILPAIALGIAFASWALTMVKPIGFTQFLTAVGIALVFAVVSFGIKKLLKAFRGIGMTSVAKAVVFLPLILPAIALGIALSSYALQLVKPITWAQFFATVFIALVFTVISYGLGKLLKAFKGLDPASTAIAAVLIPIVFIGLSYAIALSSVAFSKIKPIGFSQFLTALGIAAVFVVLSFGIQKIVRGISRTKWQDIPKLPVFFTLVSVAIMLSSHILSLAKIIPIGNLLKLAVFGVILAGIMMAMTFPIKAIAKISIKDLLMGSLGVIVISAAIMISSLVLSVGSYKKYPDWKWALGVGLSLIVFTPAIVLLGAIAMSGIGALAIVAGGAMVLVVAGTIMATSHILGKGNYKNYPGFAWSTGVAISLVAFTSGMVLLGAMIIASFGIGGVLLAAGSAAVLMVASTIVKASFILAKGKYTGGPTLAWAGGIALALAAFSPIYAMLMANGVLKIFGGGGVGPKDFAKAIITVSQGIVIAAGFFAANKAAFIGGPSKAWAEGVGLSIGAFSPVYGMLLKNGVAKIFGGGGVGPEDFARAIKTVSRGIIDAAKIFADPKNQASFKNPPPKAWAEGVGAALGAFAPVFNALSKDTGWFTSGDEVVQNMKKGVLAITSALVGAAKLLSAKGVSWAAYPSVDWAKGVGSAVGTFLGVFKTLEKYGFTPQSFMKKSIILNGAISQIAASAKILSLNAKYFSVKLDPNFIKNIASNVLGYAALSKMLEATLGTKEVKVLQRGFFGVTETTIKKPNTDVSIINTVLAQIVDSAKYLFGNRVVLTGATEVLKKMSAGQMLAPDGKSVDKGTNFIGMLSKNVLGYVALIKTLQALLTTTEIETVSKGFFFTDTTTTVRKKMSDVSIVNKVVSQMVSTAAILWYNRRFFNLNLQEDYMSKVSKNVIAFANLTNRLKELQKDQSVVKEMMGLDPISRAAKGMVKIAGAYDVLAKSIRNFSGAINTLNTEKLGAFRSLTANLAILSALDSTMFSNMLKVLESRAGVFANLLQIQSRQQAGPTVRGTMVGGPGGAKSDKPTMAPHKDKKGETSLDKLDKILAVLEQIRVEVAPLDEILDKMSKEKTKIGESEG